MTILNNKRIFALSLVLVLTGCNSVEKKPTAELNVFDELEQKINQAQVAKESSSPWSAAKNVELELIGPIYQTGFEKKAAATKALAKVLSYIENNSAQIDQITQRSLTEQFANISVSEFELGEDRFSYVPAIFNVGYGDEASMNAVFDVVLPASNQAQIGFYIDVQAWQKGVVSLQGYKTIKQTGLDRNASWFHYQLDMPNADNKAKIDGLLRMSLYAIGSDIREFASIDRDAVMKFNNRDYVVERGDGETQAFVYQDRLKLIDNEIEAKVDALDKERVLTQTGSARSVFVDESEAYMSVNTLTDYVSKVSLISLKNANQKTLLWESKQWDEYVKKAYFLPKLNTYLQLTDKFLSLKQGDKTTFKLDAQNISSLNVLEARAQALFLNQDQAYSLDIKLAKLSPLTVLGKVKSLSVSADASILYTVSDDNLLSYFDAKNQRLSQIKSDFKVNGMALCGKQNKLVYWQGKNVSIYDHKVQKHHALVFEQPLEETISNVHCATLEDKLLVMAADGSISQFNTHNYQQITQLDGDYDAYDQLNAGYILQYLSNNEFIYGGKNDLKIRSSTTQSEIRADYDKRLVRINSARSWLDKSSIKQIVFAEPIADSDITLYQTLFDKRLEQHEDKLSFLSFLNEEQADPLLVANKPSLFNALSGGISVLEEGNIMLVKQSVLDADTLYTTSIPNWQHLGFLVDTLDLGSEGFEPKVYQQLDNSQLTADIVNVSLSDDDHWLATTLSNGEVTFESLKPETVFNETFQAHETQVSAVAISSDLTLLATAGRDGLVKIWQLKLTQLTDDESWISLVKELKGYAGNVLDLAFIGNDLLVSSGSDQTIKVWDIQNSGEVKNEMLGHTASIDFARYDDSLVQIISASEDASIRVWDLEKLEQIKSFKASPGFVVAYDDASNTLAYTKNDQLLVKNIVSGNTIGRISSLSTPLAVALGFNAKVVYLVYEDRVAVYKVASGEHLNDITLEANNKINKVLTSSDSQDLYLMTDQDVMIMNMGRYALFGVDNVYQ